MLLKFKNGYGRWVILDDIDECVVIGNRTDDMTQHYSLVENYGCEQVHYEHPVDQPDLAPSYVRLLGRRRNQIVVFYGAGFLMNNDGKTIEHV